MEVEGIVFGHGGRLSLNHVVGPKQQRLRKRQAHRLRSLEIDRQIELCRLLDGQVRGRRSMQNLVYVGCRPPIEVRYVRTVAHQETGLGKFDRIGDRGQMLLERRIGNAFLQQVRKRADDDQQRADSLADQRGKGAVEVVRAADVGYVERQIESVRSCLELCESDLGRHLPDDANTGKFRGGLFEQR